MFNNSHILVDLIINSIDSRNILERMSLYAVNIAEINCSPSAVEKILLILKNSEITSIT